MSGKVGFWHWLAENLKEMLYVFIFECGGWAVICALIHAFIINRILGLDPDKDLLAWLPLVWVFPFALSMLYDYYRKYVNEEGDC